MATLSDSPSGVHMADSSRLPSPQARAFAADFRARELARHQRRRAIEITAETVAAIAADCRSRGLDPFNTVVPFTDCIVTAYEEAKARVGLEVL